MSVKLYSALLSLVLVNSAFSQIILSRPSFNNKQSVRLLSEDEIELIIEKVSIAMGEVCRAENEAAEAGGLRSCPGNECLSEGQYLIQGDRLEVELSYRNTNWQVHEYKIEISYIPERRQSLGICLHPKLTPGIARLRAGFAAWNPRFTKLETFEFE